VQPVKERKCKCRSFPGAGLSNPDNVATSKHHRDGLLLNWSGDGVALSSHGAHEWFGEPEVSEVHEWSWVKVGNIPRTQCRETFRRFELAGDSNAWCWQPF
jgi:hypothetical protein